MSNYQQERDYEIPPPKNEAEFIARFVARMIGMTGEVFEDGSSVEAYAREVAPYYWSDPLYRDDGPEACADGDMDYWGEE